MTKKESERTNYTGLSKQFGLTVPRVKKAITEAGFLLGKEPTAQAIADGVVEVKMIEGQYSGGQLVPMLLWRVKDIETILTQQGLMANVDQRTDVFIRNSHGAINRVEEAGSLFFSLLKKRWENDNDLECAILDMMCETIEIAHEIIEKNHPAVAQWLSPKRQRIENALKKYKLESHPDALRALAKLDAVLAWIQR